MTVNAALYNDLYALRGRFKNAGRRENGKAPLVCTDEALDAIASMCPKRVEDLRGIPGIGNVFIDNYGEAFIKVVRKHVITENEKTVDMGTSAMETLKELEKKLVSINRRNRLLYMPKLAAKYGYDLCKEDTDRILGMLLNQRGSVDLLNDQATKQMGFKKLVALDREINKDIREKGQNDLYIGYPFVIGRMPGENFDVRCPLALFPVSIERTSYSITVSYDDSRDALYNNVFLLAYFKFNNINKPLPDPVISDNDLRSFSSRVIGYYGDSGLKINAGSGSVVKFREYLAGEFPAFGDGFLQVENDLVIGKFPVRSSSIQKDFDSMIENGEINNLLNELLLEINELDYESDAIYGDREDKADNSTYSVSENAIHYINDLDSSQENVLSAINKIDKLVIQGPPGTGKSQTITSLIAEFAHSGKTVLMVSEKKTALDVVYSRLGDLANYALIIDDVGNKDLFYSQLDKMMHYGKLSSGNKKDAASVANEIDREIKKLEKIAQKLYEPNGFGIEPYKLYQENNRMDFNDQGVIDRASKVHSNITTDLLGVKYSDLNKVKHRFESSDMTEEMAYYDDLVGREPWVGDVIPNLTEFELADFVRNLKEFEKQLNEYKAKNILVRIFTGGKVRNGARDLCGHVISNPSKENVKMVTKEFKHFKKVINQYPRFNDARPLHDDLKKTELDYLKLLMCSQALSGLEYSDVNDEVYNQMIQEHIDIFERNNKDVLQFVNDYNKTIKFLGEAIARKKALTKENLKAILAEEMTNITMAKRSGEMQRVIEGKRKWSVNRFISKFRFELFKGVKIWLLTPEVVSEILPLEAGSFDLVIFDEASQMFVEKGLPSVFRAKKVIIAGDHKQLRPSSLMSGRIGTDEEELPEDIEMSAALDEESLLDLARFKYDNVMLNFHYRAKYEALIAFSNYAFYKGRLYVSPDVDIPEKPPIEYHLMNDARWIDRSNMEEAKYVVAKLRDILKNRKEAETIGVITFNTSQRDLIEDLLDEQCAIDPELATMVRAETGRRSEGGEDIGLFIKNIENVQGDERDIIIFSIGYAKNENGRFIRNFGWLNQTGGENRLNVAISRAKKKVHVVASFLPEHLQVEDTKNDGPKYLKKYLQYAKAVSDRDMEAQKQILMSFGDASGPNDVATFDSDFENQVYDALNDRLKQKGFTVDTQVGIGGYSIDLALKYHGKYVLGIECDGRTYHSSKAARERDYHRQKYLESRGWRIHRIWSTNWWKNPNKEIENICKLAETLVAQ